MLFPLSHHFPLFLKLFLQNNLRELWALLHYLQPDIFTASTAEKFEEGLTSSTKKRPLLFSSFLSLSSILCPLSSLSYFLCLFFLSPFSSSFSSFSSLLSSLSFRVLTSYLSHSFLVMCIGFDLAKGRINHEILRKARQLLSVFMLRRLKVGWIHVSLPSSLFPLSLSSSLSFLGLLPIITSPSPLYNTRNKSALSFPQKRK